MTMAYADDDYFENSLLVPIACGGAILFWLFAFATGLATIIGAILFLPLMAALLPLVDVVGSVRAVFGIVACSLGIAICLVGLFAIRRSNEAVLALSGVGLISLLAVSIAVLRGAEFWGRFG